MLKDLEKTLIGRAEKFATFYIALIDGLSPLLLSSIAIIPLIFAFHGFIDVRTSLLAATSLAFLEILVLGMFLGKIAKKNPLIEGMKVLSIGVILSLLLVLLERIFF